jgi:putative peptidoglycan lipid II flippase
MLKSSGAMAGATLLSRVLGMLREMLYARFMGDGPIAGAFGFAFSIPNLFRRLLGEGALTAAFVPIFKEKEAREGESAMWHVANAVLSGLVLVSLAIVFLVVGGLTLVLSGGLVDDKFRLVLELVRIIFPYMMTACLAAVFMGMLNSRGHFFLPALGAVILNLVIIPVVLFVAPRWGVRLDEQIFALAYAVVIAGVFQAMFMVPKLRQIGFRFAWVSPVGNPVLRQVWNRMIPGLLGVAAFQLNVFLTGVIAGMVDFQIYASYSYAVRLFELPQGLFGVSLATFLLPTLSGLVAQGNMPGFKSTLTQGLGYVIFINALMAGLLMLLAEPMVRLLFERGKFTDESTARAAGALFWLGLSLVPYSVNSILTRAFFALGDTRTPMRLSALCLGLNLGIVMLLIDGHRQAGLAMANCATALLNTVLLTVWLRRTTGPLGLGKLAKLAAQICVALVVGLSVCWFAHRWWDQRIGHGDVYRRIGEVFVPMILTGGAYLLAGHFLKMSISSEMLRLLSRVK